MKYINIAIDGPSGAGKSTIAKKIASDLGFLYIDTGAMYRAIGLYMYQNQIDSHDVECIISSLTNIQISLKHIDNVQHIYLNGEDVSTQIREHIISKYASDVSAIPEVRAFLLNLQRSLAKENNIIMDGRDIGTVILPDADIKIYLTASSEDRARRRYLELIEKGQKVEFEQILLDVIERDRNDMNRSEAPLRQAEDAILVDTTGNDLEESIQILKSIIKENLDR